MLQLINKKKIYFYLFSFLLLSTVINQKTFNTYKEIFLVKKIIIKNLNKELEENLLIKTNYLLNKNIITINKNNISEKINNLNYLEKINVKKNYPSTIVIDAKKTKFLASTFINQKKYIVGENGKFILASDIYYENQLPIIFGNFEI